VAVSRAGTLFLAKSSNGAIYGALTFVEIAGTDGWSNPGPGETMLFSVTNQEIYNYVGTKGKPITVGFFSENA
jgi:hypothetical protein